MVGAALGVGLGLEKELKGRDRVVAPVTLAPNTSRIIF